MTAQQIADLLKIEKRVVTRQIELLRLDAWPIMADKSADGGYWLAESENELDIYIYQYHNETLSRNRNEEAMQNCSMEIKSFPSIQEFYKYKKNSLSNELKAE